MSGLEEDNAQHLIRFQQLVVTHLAFVLSTDELFHQLVGIIDESLVDILELSLGVISLIN